MYPVGQGVSWRHAGQEATHGEAKVSRLAVTHENKLLVPQASTRFPGAWQVSNAAGGSEGALQW